MLFGGSRRGRRQEDVSAVSVQPQPPKGTGRVPLFLSSRAVRSYLSPSGRWVNPILPRRQAVERLQSSQRHKKVRSP